MPEGRGYVGMILGHGDLTIAANCGETRLMRYAASSDLFDLGDGRS